MPVKVTTIRRSLKDLMGLVEFEKPRIVWNSESQMWRAFKPSDPNFWVEDKVLQNLVYVAYHGVTMRKHYD
jgi:hypothetical protein